MNLSPNFTLEEMTQSQTASRLGIDNTPSQAVILRLEHLCETILEPARSQFGPLLISSGYRCPDLNVAIGGSRASAHMTGNAADVIPLAADKLELARWVRSSVPFDQIIPEVLAGKYEAGLIIHEGQLTYDKSGLHRIVDLGKWWQKVTGLPLPLGGNAIRRSLGPDLMLAATNALRDSIQYALDHREEALSYAMQFARDLDSQTADRFVGMYVNERTLDYGPDGREAVRRLLDMGHKAGIIGPEARVDWV